MAEQASEWMNDEDLRFQLESLVKKAYQRSEIVIIMRKEFPQYAWGCIKTLDRRLRHFNINYINYHTPLQDVKNAVEKELEGPGKLLGVRAMTKKLRMVHDIKVPRDLVNDVMFEYDPEGLTERQPCNKGKQKKGNFITQGVNWVWSLDRHDKLMGFQNWTFPIALYGCYDTASRKVLFLKVWTSNSRPELIARWYFDYIFKAKKIPSMLQLDKGTETGLFATVHAFLAKEHADMAPEDTVHFGSSTSNRIERYWKEIHERMEKFFKHQLLELWERGHYDPEDEDDRKMLAFIYIPIVQREVNIFIELWNNSRSRLQKNTLMPDGIPNFIYNNPEEYAMVDQGWEVSLDELQAAARISGVLAVEQDYIPVDFATKCHAVVPEPENIPSKDAARFYLTLRREIRQ